MMAYFRPMRCFFYGLLHTIHLIHFAARPAACRTGRCMDGGCGDAAMWRCGDVAGGHEKRPRRGCRYLRACRPLVSVP